jgi:glycosyltransferase family protein
MSENNILKRMLNVKNFNISTILLNIKSIIKPEGKAVFCKSAIKVLSVDETIEQIRKKNLSISRFGDGEIAIMTKDNGVGFQDKNDRLADRLYDVFMSSIPSLLVGLPDQIVSINNSVRRTRKFWMVFLLKHEDFLLKNLRKETVYGNTNISRFYMDFKDKNIAAESRFNDLKKIWEAKDVLIVEGEFTRSGIGNDLYDNAKSIRRIICPARNAFDIYDDIFNAVKMHGKDKLILLALGPTATVLSHDLAAASFWAFDLGHLDIEYMWMLNKAQWKTEIKGKYVNEVANSYSEELDAAMLELYNSQIIIKILK